LVREVFRANPTDFGPVSSVSALLVENADFDKAYQLLASVAEPLIRQNNAGPLLEALRRIWNKSPKHIPTLELIHRICERTADELTLPEALEALGRAHEQAGDLEKAEAAYLKLIEREPDNENYRGLLNAVQQKLGKKVKPENFSGQGMVLAAAEEPPRQAAGVDAIQEVMVKDALENSDLFARYNLREKAIAELEKVLQVYPDQIEVLQRILEISRKGNTERGAAAAAHLARMYAERGDVETANKYQAIADAKGPVHEIPLLPSSPITKGEGPVRPSPAPPERPGAGMATEIPIPVIAPEEPVTAAAAPPPDAVSLDVTPPGAPSEPPVAPPPPPVPAEQTMELDLSEDLESLVAFSFEAPPPSVSEPPSAPGEESIPAELEESRIEVEFYLENGLVDEARQVMAEVEEKYPGGPLVSELRWRLDQQAAEAPPVESPASAVPTEEAAAAELQIEVVQAEPEVAPPPAPVAEEPTHEEWELPSEYAVPPQPEPAMDTVVPPLVTEPEASPPVAEFTAPPPAREPVVEEPVVSESGGLDILSELARDLASSLDGLIESSDAPPAALADSPMAVFSPPADPAQGAAQLDGLLAEMEEAGAAETAKDDPETHYNLGVAFREMGLLDEAIGEFQKVVKGSGKENYPSNFLQACSLLAICFMEKKMPAIAVKWYGRALETPGLEEEALMALQYDLGLAYEGAGDSRSALERFTEVYSQNIDFRDVADKIRELQQKA
jgi:tetratricopeptide (TPR) repeat protein